MGHQGGNCYKLHVIKNKLSTNIELLIHTVCIVFPNVLATLISMSCYYILAIYHHISLVLQNYRVVPK